MPELPEVETIARDLESKIKGLKVLDAEVFDRRVIFGLTPQAFIRSVKDKTFASFDRRGKAVIIGLKPEGYLIIQPKMSGYVMYYPSQFAHNSEETLRPKGTASGSSRPVNAGATKAVFQLSNKGVLHYNDHRMFGWLYYADDLSDVKYFRNLGPEPLEEGFTVDLLKDVLSRRSSPMKVVLMDQSAVAGIGNIYASEILFDARIDPRKIGSRLSAARVKVLHGSICKILKKAIKERGCSMRDYRDTSGQAGTFMNCIKVYGRDGHACSRCGSKIRKIVQTQRSTFFCAKCQT